MRHIEPLLQHQVVTNLVRVITCKTYAPPVIDQALWALFNLSTIQQVVPMLVQDSNNIVMMLSLVGIQCFPPPQPSSSSGSTGKSKSVDSLEVLHINLKENPSLSSMRHISFICSNIIK